MVTDCSKIWGLNKSFSRGPNKQEYTRRLGERKITRVGGNRMSELILVPGDMGNKKKHQEKK